MERQSTQATPQTTVRDWAADIAKARARLKKLEKKSTKDAKAKDTRCKVLLGVGLLNAMKTDKDLWTHVMPSIRDGLTEKDWATLSGLMGERK